MCVCVSVCLISRVVNEGGVTRLNDLECVWIYVYDH